MAPRFQMKLGVLADRDRLPDSPDTVVVVEPTVGSRSRSKGQLYLLVTSMVAGPKAREATSLVADVIRNEYYYDESAGIRVCLIKAILAANKRLAHARERAAVAPNGQKPAPSGPKAGPAAPIGVAIAVVRDHELYVATVGPAEAYLSRGARLSTLPDPDRERGLPTPELEPDVWRGEIGVGDQLALVSPNVMTSLGPDELKDALMTLHPQPAVEHLAERFAAAGGTGSDGAIVIEVGEAAATKPGRTLVAVKPPEPLAGAPDRSPIPLADSVSGGVAAATAGARRARDATRDLFARLLGRVQDSMPARRPAPRRVTPLGARREMQRRAAVAILVFLAVAGSLGLGVSLLGNRPSRGGAIASAEAGASALANARQDLTRVFGPGNDLVATDPGTARSLLDDALAQLDIARRTGIAVAVITPLRTQAIAGLDRLDGVVDVVPVQEFAFPASPAVDLQALIRGPDGAAYVLDGKTSSVYRISLTDKKAVSIYREGTKSHGTTEAAPKFIVTGGPYVLILDARNVLWSWRPADTTGRGTTNRVSVVGSADWGSDLVAIGTFLRDASSGLFNFYVVDPSAQEILAYAPAADGNGFPATPSKRFTTPQPVDGVTSLYIDGDIWLADSGRIERLVGGSTAGWSTGAMPDTNLRAAPKFSAIMSGSDRRAGDIYGYDPANARLVAFLKATGDYDGQYRLAGGAAGWAGVRGWYVEPGIADAPDTVVWITATGLFRAVLAPATSAPGASPSPGPSAASSGAPASSARPTRTPRPSPTR